MATAAKPEVFSRKASGLSRVMSPWSAFMYNFLTMGVIFPWTFVWAPAAFPGVSVWKACLLAIFLELPIALAYVWMATAMPRSGGDYVFQSRVLGGAIGFPVVMSGFVIWILQWVALAGWLLATLGVAPLFMGLGVYYKSTSLINAAVWCQSAQGHVIISVVGAALMAILLVTGFKNYVRLQYFMFAATGILMVILVVQFLRTQPGAVRDGDEPLQLRRRRPHELLPVDPQGRLQRRRQPDAEVRSGAPRSSPSRSSGRACSGPRTAWSRAARSRAPASSRTRCSSSSAP